MVWGLAIRDSYESRVLGAVRIQYGPWTSEGANCLSNFLEYLVKALEECVSIDYELDPFGTNAIAFSAYIKEKQIKKAGVTLNTIKGGLTFLEETYSEVEAGHWDAVSVEAFNAVKEQLNEKLMIHSDQAWWLHAPLVRALSIGMKDLWEHNDFRALKTMLKNAKDISASPSTQEASRIPFHWARDIVDVPGVQLGKFLGESDALLGLQKSLKQVVCSCFPSFNNHLLD